MCMQNAQTLRVWWREVPCHAHGLRRQLRTSDVNTLARILEDDCILVREGNLEVGRSAVLCGRTTASYGQQMASPVAPALLSVGQDIACVNYGPW